MDGDEARHLLRLRIAESLGDARCLNAGTASTRKLEAHELAALRIVGIAAGDGPLFQLLAFDGVDDAGPAGKRAEDAEHPLRRPGELLDGARLIRVFGIGPESGDTREHAVADAGGGPRVALAFDHEDAGRSAMLLVPGGRPRHELAVSIARDDLDHRDRRQGAGLGELPARPGDQTVVGHAAQKLFQGDTVATLHPEGARDLALAGLAARGFEKIENFLF